jgi:two-component system LytT family response regulator
MRIRTLVIEDEPLARQSLRALIDEVSWLEYVGEAADGHAAIAAVDDLEPDLVFLDVKLPELSGLDVLERIHHHPVVVFTTAFDRYAVPAFELEAVDYLVKPFGRKRFLAAVDRVRRRLEGDRGSALSPPSLRAALGGGPLRRFFVRDGERMIPISIDAIGRIEAQDDYAAVHTAEKAYLVHTSLAELEARLDGTRFLRIHRSHIVNLDHVAMLQPFDERRLLVVLRGGAKVVASRAGSQLLRELVE